MRTIPFLLGGVQLFSACGTNKPTVAPPIIKAPTVLPIPLDSVVTAIQAQ